MYLIFWVNTENDLIFDSGQDEVVREITNPESKAGIWQGWVYEHGPYEL